MGVVIVSVNTDSGADRFRAVGGWQSRIYGFGGRIVSSCIQNVWVVGLHLQLFGPFRPHATGSHAPNCSGGGTNNNNMSLITYKFI